MPRNKSIGIFDSGFGGLSVMKGIVKELPDYNYIYLGDSARVPYGTRSKKTVYKYTKQAIEFLFKKSCELVIVACNTASSDALRLIQQKHVPKHYASKKVLGVLIPAAEDACKKTKNRRIGVIATEGTVRSGAFIRELLKLDPRVKIFQKACPLLVPIVEAGEQNLEITEITLIKYLKPLIGNKIDTLILGCTHYGILEPKIRKIVGKKMKIISESRIIAHKLKNYLERHPEIEEKLAKNRKKIFYSTDLTRNFEILGSKFFGEKIKPQKADL